MFRVTQSPTFWSDISITIVTEDTGEKKYPFKQQFPRMSAEQLKKFGEIINRDVLNDNAIARALMTGEWTRVIDPGAELGKVMKWLGVVDEQDQPLDPSPGTIDMLLSNVGLGSAISKKFFEDIGKAGSKN